MSLVLDIDGTGIDRSRFRTDLSKVGKVILGGRPKYDGATGYLDRAQPKWRSGDAQGTVMGWFATTGADDYLICSGDEGGATSFWGVILTNKQIGIVVFQGGTNDIVVSTTEVDDGTWRHLAITANASSFDIYINGVLETPHVLLGSDSGRWLSTVTGRDNIILGARKINSTSGYWTGSIDDVKVYDEVLAADWIKAYYEQSRQHRLSA